MQVCTKSSFKYRLRLWAMVALGILIVLNASMILFVPELDDIHKIVWVWMAFTIFDTCWEIKHDVSVVVSKDCVTSQELEFLVSLIGPLCLWGKRKAIVIAVIEGMIIGIGIIIIYRNYYKGAILAKKKRRKRRKEQRRKS